MCHPQIPKVDKPNEMGYAKISIRDGDIYEEGIAEPYRCGFALVSVNDVYFYIGTNGAKAFESVFEFAESFHHDRALVRSGGLYRIVDTQGKTVADLN